MLGCEEVRKRQLGKALKLARAERGLTQDQVARILGASLAAYQSWESGRSTPSIFMLIDLSNFYRAPLAELVGKTAVNSAKEVYTLKKRGKRASAASL